MDIFEKRILRSLLRHGALTQTELYRYFHRQRAAKKNMAVANLLKEGMIDREIRWMNQYARKPARIFTLSASGRQFILEHPLQKGVAKKNSEASRELRVHS
jgi:hypothetical protein